MLYTVELKNVIRDFDIERAIESAIVTAQLKGVEG